MFKVFFVVLLLSFLTGCKVGSTTVDIDSATIQGMLKSCDSFGGYKNLIVHTVGRELTLKSRCVDGSIVEYTNFTY